MCNCHGLSLLLRVERKGSAGEQDDANIGHSTRAHCVARLCSDGPPVVGAPFEYVSDDRQPSVGSNFCWVLLKRHEFTGLLGAYVRDRMIDLGAFVATMRAALTA